MSIISMTSLQNRIDNVIDIYRSGEQSDRMTNVEIIGVLELIKLNIYQESRPENDEDDDFSVDNTDVTEDLN